MRAAALSPKTIDLRTYQIRRLAAHAQRPPGDVTTADVLAFVAAQDWSPATRKSFRAGIRSFYRNRNGAHAPSPADVLPAVRLPRYLPKPAHDDCIRAALTDASARTALAIRLAAESGPRRTELAQLHRDDITRTPDGWSARIVGKGGHVRYVPLTDSTAALALRAEGWLFPSPGGGHLTPQHLAKTISQALGHHTTHALRHRAGTEAYAKTRDLRAVQELLGHARPETTAIYTAVNDLDVRACLVAIA